MEIASQMDVKSGVHGVWKVVKSNDRTSLIISRSSHGYLILPLGLKRAVARASRYQAYQQQGNVLTRSVSSMFLWSDISQ